MLLQEWFAVINAVWLLKSYTSLPVKLTMHESSWVGFRSARSKKICCVDKNVHVQRRSFHLGIWTTLDLHRLDDNDEPHGAQKTDHKFIME